MNTVHYEIKVNALSFGVGHLNSEALTSSSDLDVFQRSREKIVSGAETRRPKIQLAFWEQWLHPEGKIETIIFRGNTRIHQHVSYQVYRKVYLGDKVD